MSTFSRELVDDSGQTSSAVADPMRIIFSRAGTLRGVHSGRFRCAAAVPYVAVATLPRMGTATGAHARAKLCSGGSFDEVVGLISPSDDDKGEEGERDKDTANNMTAK